MSLQAKIIKDFGSFKLDIDIDVDEQTLGFLGASGCGKSLTLRCIAGIERPDEGRIVVNGKTFFDSEAGINLTPQERKTALLFQNYMLFPNMTVEKNIGAGIPKEVSKEERGKRIAAELNRFGLSGFADRYPSQLSGGQQQRVALARMLAARPGILMLDEPFSALDSHLKDMLELNLLNLFATFDGTVLYVSHDIDEAMRLCDSIAVVESGKILEIDNPDELVHNPKSEAALKLSGCKNVVMADKVSSSRIYVDKWGVTLETAADVPDDLKYIGVRANYINRADKPGDNVFRMRVDRISDARFERSMFLSFIDRSENAEPLVVNPELDEMHYMHQRLYWRVNTLNTTKDELPNVGDEILLEIPKNRIYMVCQ